MNLENFKQRVACIRAGLVSGEADWKDINEATVRQVIALPLLQAAGFDIWNPAEVKPEVPTSSGGRVDVWLNYQGTTLYILELKKLNLSLKDKETEQAINYAASQAVKWAMATNGLEWKLFDAFDVNKKSIEREVLTVSLHEAEYLFDLLSIENWKNNVDVVGLIEGKRAKIKRIAEIRTMIQEEIEYTYDETGEGISEKLAIHNLKRSGNLQDADIQMYWDGKNTEDAEDMIDVDLSLLDKKIEHMGVSDLQSPDTNDILRDILEFSGQSGGRQDKTFSFEAHWQGVDIGCKNWTNLYAAVAYCALKRNIDIPNIYQDRSETKGRYLEIMQGVYLYVNFTALNKKKLIVKVLKVLNVPAGVLKVVYQQYATMEQPEVYLLP